MTTKKPIIPDDWSRFTVAVDLPTQEAKDFIDYCQEKNENPQTLLRRLIAEEIAR